MHRNNKTKKNHQPKGVVTVGLIYANWCGHCQSLKPEWQTMKNSIIKSPSYKGGQYKFTEIEDSDELKDSKINEINTTLKGGTLSANGYPTIFKISGGKISYYQGNRSANELRKWFMSSSGNNPLLRRTFGGKRRPGIKKGVKKYSLGLKSAPIWRDNSLA
jgi:thiol-disulfide isomerase/thioredoxin